MGFAIREGKWEIKNVNAYVFAYVAIPEIQSG